LQACDTSDLHSAEAGEWLTIAPAFLAAGASVVVSTLFPLADADDPDAELLSSLLAGDDLRSSIRKLQLEHSRRWDAEDGAGVRSVADAPVVWGAYVVSAVGAADLDLIEVFRRENLKEREERLSVGAWRLFTCTVRTTRGLRGRVVSTADVLSEYLDDTDLTWDTGWRTLFLFLGSPVLARWFRLFEHGSRGGKVRPTEELLECIRRASVAAALESRDLESEHVAREILATQTAGLRMARFLNTIGVVRESQIRNIIEDNLGQSLFHPLMRAPIGGKLLEFLPGAQAILRAALPESPAVALSSGHHEDKTGIAEATGTSSR
jgi:hypothetical protein